MQPLSVMPSVNMAATRIVGRKKLYILRLCLRESVDFHNSTVEISTYNVRPHIVSTDRYRPPGHVHCSSSVHLLQGCQKTSSISQRLRSSLHKRLVVDTPTFSYEDTRSSSGAHEAWQDCPYWSPAHLHGHSRGCEGYLRPWNSGDER